MVVTKILEAILYAGSQSVTFTDSEIPNSLLRIYSDDNSLIYKSATLSGNTVTVTYDAQINNKNIALEIVKSGLDIVDDLLSTDNSKALSANQGRALKSLIDGIVIPTSYPADDITYDNTDTGMAATNVQDAIDEVFTGVSSGKALIADAITDKGVTTSATDSFATMATNISNIPTGGGGDNPVIGHIYGSMSSFNESYTMTKAGTLIIYGLVLGTNNVVTSKNNVNVTQTYAYATSSPATRMRYWEFSVAVGDVIKVTATGITSAKTLIMIV